MGIQTSYPETFAVGLEGDLADSGSDRHVRTFVEENGVAYFFGRAVERGTSGDEFIVPLGTAANFMGVTVHTHAVELSELPDATLEGIPSTKPANVLTKGRVLVLPETAVAPGSAVYYRFQNAGADPEGQGRFRSDNDGGSLDVVQLPVGSGAVWRTAAAAGEPAVLELNLPV